MAATVTRKLELFLELKDKIAAEAKKSAGALRDVGDEAQKAQDKLTDLASRYSLTARNADLLKKRLDELKSSGKASTDQIERAQLRYDAAAAALAKIERQATRTAEGFGKVGSAAQSSSTTIDRSVRNIDNSIKATDNSVRSLTQNFTNNISEATGGIDSLVGGIGRLATAWIGLEAITASWNAGVAIEANRTTLNALMGDVDRRNKVWNEGAEFARKYGFTQQEIAGTLSAAAPIIRKYNTNTEDTLGVLARLAALNPAEGIEGATVAFKELASGDTTSIVERFNLSRDAAKAMVAEIKAGADPVKVLDQYLNQMGATNELLAARMEGANGATNTFKQGVEDLKLSLFGLLDRIHADDGLALLGNWLSGIGKFIDSPTTAFNGAVEGLSNLSGAAEQSQRFIEGLKQPLGDVTFMVGELASLQAHAAASSEENAVKVAELTAQYQDGTISTQEYRDALLELAPTYDATSSSIEGFNDAVFNNIGAILEATNTIEQNIDALDRLLSGVDANEQGQIDLFFANQESAASAETNAQQQAILGQVLEGLADQTMGPQQAMYLLHDAFGVTGQKANELYFQLQALAAPLMMLRQLMGVVGGIGKSIGAAGAAAGLDKAIAIGLSNPANIGLSPTQAALAKKNRGGGGGGRSARGARSGGKSDADRAAEKAAKEQEKIAKAEQKELEKRQEQQAKYRKNLEERTLQHYARLAKINADYYQQAQANERKFNGEKFSDRADFWNAAADQEGQQRARLLAEEERLWNESQKIAQTGRAAEAQEYYEAGLKIIQQQAERDAQIAELRKAAAEAATEEERKELEARADLRQRADNDLTEQENQRLENMKNAEDSAKKERDEALSEEQADYLEATTKLKDQLVETSDALTAYANQQMQLFQNLAEAAAKAQQAVNTFVPGSTAVPEARAFGGRMQMNQPYIVNDGRGRNAGPELIVPDRPGTVIPADRTRAILAAERTIMQPPSTPTFGPASGNTTNTTISMPVSLTFASGTPSREVQMTRREIEAIFDDRLARANRVIGSNAVRRNRTS